MEYFILALLMLCAAAWGGWVGVLITEHLARQSNGGGVMEERSHSKQTRLTYYKGACEIHLTLHYDDAYSAAVEADAINREMGNRGAFHVNFGDKISERSPTGSS